MAMRGALLELSHDQPVGRALSPPNHDARLFGLSNASLGAAAMKLFPCGGLAAFDRNFEGDIARSAMKSGCGRKLSSRLHLHPPDPTLLRPFPERHCQGVGRPGVVRERP